MIHHEPVPCLHTSLIVEFRQYDNLVCLFQRFLICFPFFLFPSVGLGSAGDNDDKPDIRMPGAKRENFQGCNGVKSTGTAA